MDFEEFRLSGHDFVSWMADYLSEIERYPVRAQVEPGAILAQLPREAPQDGESIARIFADFTRILLPGITHWQHPRFLAYFPANSSPPSVLAEMLTATLGAQCMLWETSPAAAELEVRVMEWLAALIGLPPSFTGSIQDSASSATILAIIAAAERASGGRFSRDGLAGGPRLILYCSAEAHSSVEKGARIVGIGAANVRKIPVDSEGALKVPALREAIAADRACGHVPAGIVACFGTTGIGAVDPIAQLSDIARAEDIHLHVDAAWAGAALILPELRGRAAGLDGADSIVFNPHKWLMTNFDCSAFFMRDPVRLAGALSLTPAYLETRQTAAIPEYRDWSIALGRRFRALKLWFVLRSYGIEGLRTKLRADLAAAERLASVIRQSEDFELTSGPNFALLSFRYAPSGVADLDGLNEKLLRAVNDSGFTYLTKTRHGGRLVIRISIGQTYTTWRHIEESWHHIAACARALAR
ncbi:MAG: aminotransferase class V-fold PLP-dependent enzyme [Alphaproteobacteria bacterium]|nr:aminotransferase class V-fold PLP-dependent enzyme [Alphaproteobacteria bacterium]